MRLPIVFGANDEVFGWYHAPEGKKRSRAIVLCNTLGHEQAAAHRTYRHLAERLAAAGYPVLRFDYPSTGDSAGDAGDPKRIAAALESIRTAMDEVKARSGAADVALFGIRIGAVLAAASGARHVVQWASVASGAAYARELRLIARAAQIPLEVSEETLGDLAKLEMPRFHGIDLGKDGWQELMRDPHEAVVPEVMIEKAIAAFDAPHAELHPTSKPSRALRCGDLREEAVEFDGLFGIKTLPATKPEMGVVLATVGGFHRIGPGRLYVHLARALAKKGLAILRFDLRGIGDSPAAPGEGDNVLYRPQAIAEVRAAIDTLGLDRVAAIGVCSGAYASYETAKVDPRVAKLVLVNIPTFSWRFGDPVGRGTTLSSHAYRRKLFERETWRRLARGEIHAREVALSIAARIGKRIVRRASGKSDVESAFQAMCDRGTDVTLIYASDDPGLDEARLHEIRHAKFAIRLIDEGDHAFVSRSAQEKLTKILVELL